LERTDNTTNSGVSIQGDTRDHSSPEFLLGPTDKFASFALGKLVTWKKLARGTSSLQGGSNCNQIKYHGSENKSSCLTQKGNSSDGEKNIVSGQLRKTFCSFSYQTQNIIICTVLAPTAVLSVGNIHAWFVCLALLESL